MSKKVGEQSTNARDRPRPTTPRDRQSFVVRAVTGQREENAGNNAGCWEASAEPSCAAARSFRARAESSCAAPKIFRCSCRIILRRSKIILRSCRTILRCPNIIRYSCRTILRCRKIIRCSCRTILRSCRTILRCPNIILRSCRTYLRSPSTTARQRGGWEKLAIDLDSPYLDKRPLLDPAVPETREYATTGVR